MRTATRAGLGMALVVMACASSGPSGAPAAPPPAAQAEGVEAFELAAGVVIDPAARAVYLARPEGGIAAFELETGRPRWTSDAAARPLAARFGLLVAQRASGAGLPLAILDTADGTLRQRLEAPLPEGVRAAVDESLEVRFTVSVRGAGDRLRIDWDYLERDVLGVSPPGGRPFARHEVGALGLDLGGGEAKVLKGDELPALAGEPLPPAIERLVASGQLRVPPWRTGGLLAATRQIHQPGARRLVLDRWRADTGEPLPEVTLQPGRPVTDIVMDPTDWGTAYVSDATDVYQTHDSGLTWTPITGNLALPLPAETRIGTLAIDPGPPGRLFAGGRFGVYELPLPTPGVVPGGPFVWGEIGTGLPNAPVWDMEWDATDAKLVVGTLGRGAWSLQENGACGGGLVPDRLKVRNQWVAATQLDKACIRITGGPALDVNSGGDLTFQSPTILLQNGFAVKTGGTFKGDNTLP